MNQNKKKPQGGLLRRLFGQMGFLPQRMVVDETEAYYAASQWQLMGRKFRKHKLARIAMVVLGLLYLQALLGQFIAPQGLTTYSSAFVNCGPTPIRIVDDSGRLRAPFVYGIATERDPVTMRKHYTEDRSRIYPIQFFTRGEPYRFLGLFESDLHLFGVGEGGRIFLYGTDGGGRDLFSRIVLGSQVSLSLPLVGLSVSFVLGLVIGSISGYFGGIVDSIIQRLIEVLMSFPTLPLWMALSAAIPPRVPMLQMYLLITMILSLLSWTGLARTVRGKFMSLREEDYVMAARLAGVSDRKIIMTHLIPGFMSYLIVSMTMSVPAMIIGETSMSFLGLGLRSPVTSWGVLLKEAQEIQNVALYSWKLIPLVYVIVTVISFNFFGDGLRDAADPYT